MVVIDTGTPQLKVAQRWIDAYVALDTNKISTLFSKNYRHQMLPKSIGLPEETEEEYIQRLGVMLPVFVKFDPVTIHAVIEVPGKVVIHATDVCSTVYGLTLTYEAIYTLSFVEEGEELKVSRCEEFIDSQEYGTFTTKIAKAATEGVSAS